MRRLTVAGIDVIEVERAVAPNAYANGVRYVRDQAVLHMEWDDAEFALSGLVRGSGRQAYHVAVYFDPDPDGGLSFDTGECTCPVQMDCKHVVAVALAAAASTATGPSDRSGPSPLRPQPDWERSLLSLFEPAALAAADARGGAPLAIELSLSTPGSSTVGCAAPGTPATPRLLARVVRQGKTGWVSGGMSWSGLASLHHQGHRDSHLRLLRELYALSRSAHGQQGYFYGYREDKTIDLASFESRQLWSMLEEADSIGLRLVHTRKGLGRWTVPEAPSCAWT